MRSPVPQGIPGALAWGDNLDAQYQLGVNQAGGGFHEWIDKEKLTVW
jgi:hypothetical protein